MTLRGYDIHRQVQKVKVPDNGLGTSDHERARAAAHEKVQDLVGAR